MAKHPRSPTVKVFNKFTKGLVTESTGLNFPEDAVTDTMNVVFEPEGIARRRKGFGLEPAYQGTTDGEAIGTKAIVEYYWRNAAGNAAYNFAVVQRGNYIYFYATDATALSSGEMGQQIDLGDFKVSGAPNVYQVQASFASGMNFLFVSHPYCDPFYVEYDPDDATTPFTAHQIDIQIRDFEGLDDELDVDERPTSLSSKHKYNLKNQGWHTNVQFDDGGVNVEPIAKFYNTAATPKIYPANTDIWWLFKNANGVFRPEGKAFQIGMGNTAAPKGHYILDAFRQDRSDVSGVGSFSIVTSSYYRPSNISFFAGRVWYSGVGHKKFSSTIYFSQIAEDEGFFGKCYQSNDPTSEQASDLLPSDGGTIKIPDIGTVYKMIPIQSSMLVFASNGVWSISGSEGLGFKADDYSIRKISSVSALNQTSFVDVEGFAMWWNQEGIYGVTTDQVGSFQVQSVTDTSIKSFLDDVPVISKTYAKATYNSLDKVIKFIYRSTEEADSTERYEYDRVLNYNLISQGWYVHSITTGTGVTVTGILSYEGNGSTSTEDNVINAALDTVIDAAMDNVIVNTDVQVQRSSVTKYFAVLESNDAFTWAEEYRTTYTDWDEVSGGDDYDSYFTSGYSLDGSAVNNIQSNYLFVYCNTEASSSVYVQSVFDWTTDASTGRWSTPQQGYKANRSNYGVKVAKLKARGHGKAIQVRFTSQSGMPFNIIGWTMFETMNSMP
jgi:hypothetical protein